MAPSSVFAARDARRAPPLQGLRVLDLSRYLPGPYATMVLADLGADVVKVEEPGVGDPVRWIPPRLRKAATLHLALNRGKRSITIDIRTREGRIVLERLARTADVLLESFRPGVMGRLGLGYDALQRIHPRIIYASISGFGRTGPLSTRAGHDLGYQALAGVLSLTREPSVPGLQAADIAGGALPAVIAILAALEARHRTGRGQHIDVSMLEGTLALMPFAFSKWMAGAESGCGQTELTGSRAYYNVYQTRDGRQVALAALEPKFWEGFCRAVGRPDLTRRHLDEGAAAEELTDVVRGIIAERTLAQWIELGAANDVCLEPVLDLEEALEQPVAIERGVVEWLHHPREGDVPQIPFAPRLSDTPVKLGRPAPRLGEHTAELLSEIGYSAREQAALARAGATALPPSPRALLVGALRELGITAGPLLARWLSRRRA